MQRYFIDEDLKDKDCLILTGNDLHHLKNVMRSKNGEKIICIDINGMVYLCVIDDLEQGLIKIVEELDENNELDVEVTLVYALPKGDKFELVLQKATELGVNKLLPLYTKRCVVKVEPKKELSKKQRWNKICKEASEQSFRSDIPVISNILSLNDLMKENYDLKLLCSLNKNTENIKKVLEKNNKCVKILLVVGPEGGFEPSEEEFLVKNGFLSVSLGENVLRAETAVVAGISMIKYEYMR